MQPPSALTLPTLPLHHATKNAPGMATICTKRVATMSSAVVSWTSLMPKLVAISMMVWMAMLITKKDPR